MITLEEKMTLWADDVVQGLRNNFQTQHIFPFEVYPGYLKKNDERKGAKSTRRAYDTILSHIIATGADNAHVDFFFNSYLYFVDIGVGRGRPASTIDRVADAKDHKKRYKEWKGEGDRQSRPSIEIEFKYQLNRLNRYVMARYALDAQFKIIHTLEDVGK